MSCRHLGQRRAEIGYDPETATVRLSPTWGTTPRPLGFAPEPMLGREFLRRGAGSFRTGWGLVRPRRPEPATDRRPADESTAGPRGVKTTIRGRESRVRDQTDRPQKPEGSASKPEGVVSTS